MFQKKYKDFRNIFLLNFKTQLAKNKYINNNTIELEKKLAITLQLYRLFRGNENRNI